MTDFCNNEEWLAAYIDRRLTERERAAFERHVAECPLCLRALFNAKRALDEISGGTDTVPALGNIVPRKAIRSSESTHADRSKPPLSTPAGSKSRSATAYLALGTAVALVVLLSLVFFSPAWDPGLSRARIEIVVALSQTHMGDLRLADGRERPNGASKVIRGDYTGGNRRLERRVPSSARLRAARLRSAALLERDRVLRGAWLLPWRLLCPSVHGVVSRRRSARRVRQPAAVQRR